MRQHTVVMAALVAACIPAFTASAQDPATKARTIQEVTQVNAYAEKFFRRLADDTAYAKSWTAAVTKRDWTAAARLAASAAGAPATSVTVSATLTLGGGDFEAAAVPAAPRPGPWISTVDESGSPPSADTLVICFNLVIIKGCYVRTSQ